MLLFIDDIINHTPNSTISKGTLLVDSSTIDPSVAKDMSAKSIKFGASYVDAPVSGGDGHTHNHAPTTLQWVTPTPLTTAHVL